MKNQRNHDEDSARQLLNPKELAKYSMSSTTSDWYLVKHILEKSIVVLLTSEESVWNGIMWIALCMAWNTTPWQLRKFEQVLQTDHEDSSELYVTKRERDVAKSRALVSKASHRCSQLTESSNWSHCDVWTNRLQPAWKYVTT
jgi:hypothetical protein